MTQEMPARFSNSARWQRCLAACGLLLALTIYAPACSAARLYVVVLADTLNFEAGSEIAAGRDVALRWARFLELNLNSPRVAKAARIPVTTFVLDGQKFNTESVRDVINDRMKAVEPDDSILFYYIGHGTNHPGTPYPRLLIRDADGSGDGLAFERIVDVLRSKGANFLLAVAEACNQTKVSVVAPKTAALDGTHDYYNEVKSLFFGTSLEFITTAASPGGFAYVNDKGGIYSSHLFNAIRNEIVGASKAGRSASWDAIADEAVQPIAVGKDIERPQVWLYK